MHHGPRSATLTAVAAVAVLILSSCSSTDAVDTHAAATALPEAFTKLPSTAAMDDCGPGSGTTFEDGVITVATSSPGYEPWFVDGDPSNGKGYEGAVARAVANRLGYGPEQTKYVTVAFNDALTGGEKLFDFDIDQFTIADNRRDAVDFSSPYYAVAQAVLAMGGTPASRARSLADLMPYRLGAQIGSTSLTAITETIRSGLAPTAFATNDEAKAALADGRIDALVVDIPTGFQIARNEIDGSVLVGQFPRPNAVTEFFGLVLEKDSPLTPCVSAAVDSLYADGTLDTLAGEWITDIAGASVLD